MCAICGFALEGKLVTMREIGLISCGSQTLDLCTDKISAMQNQKLKTNLSLEIMNRVREFFLIKQF